VSVRVREIEERANAACEQNDEQGEFRAPVGIMWYAQDVPWLLARVRDLEDALRAWPQDGSVHEPGCLTLRIGGTERDCDCFTSIARAVLASETVSWDDGDDA
jgi:hypothetical protein